MSDVRTKFLIPMTRQFKLPDGAKNEPELWEKDYQRILGTFSDEVLERAADLMLATRQKSIFPLPSECNRACLDALEMLNLERRHGSKPSNRHELRDFAGKYPEWSEKHIKKTDELFAACAFAKAACDEDWSWTLWTWIQKNGRMPDPHEAVQIKSTGVRRMRDIEDELGLGTKSVDELSLNPMACRLIHMLQSTRDRLNGLTENGTIWS